MKNLKRGLLYAWWTKKKDEVEARMYTTTPINFSKG